jgi:tetratricopeptide (TPR) repeat protein
MKRLLSSVVLVFTVGAFAPAFVGSDAVGAAVAAEKKDERRVLKLSDVGTETKSDYYRQKAREKRHQAMDFLQDILKNNPPRGEQKAEMLLRLADLYFEEGRDVYLTEMEAFKGQFDNCFNSPGCDTATMKAQNDASLRWQNKSIKIYNLILRSYSQFARADEATYFLASALQDTDRADEAVKQFARLVRTYPESRFVPDAYIMIGEYYFEHNNAYKALLAYQKATRYKNSSKYAFAMYKLGWCYYNVGEYGKAIDTMKSVVAYSMTAQEGHSERSRLTLQDEALKDLVRFFADAGEMDEAYAYFTKLGKKELIRKMLKRLAETYFEQGKFEQCIQTYRRLIAEEPQSAKAPDYQNEIILAYQKIGRKRETLNEIKRLLDSYGKNSAWARANSADQDSVNEAQGYIEKNLRTVAINYHNDAKKLGQGNAAKESYALAYKAYSVYLVEFPTSKYSYDIRYAFGELLYKIKRYDEAYAQYMKVVSIDTKGKHSRFCAESSIFAADEMVKRTKSTSPKPTSKTNSAPLSEWEQNLLNACDQWSKLFPDDKKTRNIIYKSAYLLYHKNHFKDASDRFRVVIGMNPRSKEAEQAANLILDSFNLVEDWRNLKDVSKAFYDQDGLGSSNFKKATYNIYERASFKLIALEKESTKDGAKAADGFMAFYGEFPKSEVADVAVNNAAVYYHETGHVQKSMDARLVIVQKFPKSKYYNDAVANLGFDYENIADFASAASYYEKLFKLDKEHEAAKEAIYSAALFRTALDEPKQAIVNYKVFITTYPTDERVQDVKIEIGKILEDHKKWPEAAKVYQGYFSKPDGKSVDSVFFAKLHYGLALEQSGQSSKADAHYTKMIADFNAAKASGVKMELAVEFTAQVMLKKARPKLDRALTNSLSGPSSPVSPAQEQKIIKDQLANLKKGQLEVEAEYLKIIQTGAGEYGLSALVDLGRLYEHVAYAFRNAYVPPNLTTEQIEFYQMNLEDKAFPNEEKAVQAYTQALGKSYELNLYNENTARAVRQLAAIRPAIYHGLEEGLATPRYTATSTVSGTQFETAL